MRAATGVVSLAAGLTTIVLLGFVASQVWLEYDFAFYAADHIGEERCCAPPIGQSDVVASAALVVFGIPAACALAYLAAVLFRTAFVGATTTTTTVGRSRRTTVAIALVGLWTVLFFALGWRP